MHTALDPDPATHPVRSQIMWAIEGDAPNAKTIMCERPFVDINPVRNPVKKWWVYRKWSKFSLFHDVHRKKRRKCRLQLFWKSTVFWSPTKSHTDPHTKFQTLVNYYTTFKWSNDLLRKMVLGNVHTGSHMQLSKVGKKQTPEKAVNCQSPGFPSDCGRVCFSNRGENQCLG